MSTIIGIIYISILCSLFYKAFHRKSYSESDTETEKEQTSLSYVSLEEHINILNCMKERLNIIEQMITDIEVCSPESEYKGVCISVPDNQGKYNKYELLIDGEDDNSLNLLDILYNERQQLRTSLCEEIEKYSTRCNENCNGNYPIYDRGVG